MFRRKCKITFICHGSTIYSEENRFCDNRNYPPLNEVGKLESEKIAKWVQKRSPKVDKIYTSSDLKSIQTCKYTALEYKKDFEIIDNIYSKKAGKWSGLNFEQLEKLHPDELEAYHKDRADFKPENGESNREFSTRIRNVISELIKQNTGKRIIIVTSADIIKAEISAALDIPIQNMGQIHIPCGSATQLSYFEDWTSLVYCGHVPV